MLFPRIGTFGIEGSWALTYDETNIFRINSVTKNNIKYELFFINLIIRSNL